jgi:hypothetical protein
VGGCGLLGAGEGGGLGLARDRFSLLRTTIDLGGAQVTPGDIVVGDVDAAVLMLLERGASGAAACAYERHHVRTHGADPGGRAQGRG